MEMCGMSMKHRLSSLMILWVACLGAGCAGLKNTTDNTSPMESPFVADGYLEPSPSLGNKGYAVEKIADKVYFFTTGVYNNIFIVTGEGVIATDPIRGKGSLLKQAIAEITDQPIKFLIYSHPHLDHIGDAHLFARGAQIIAHKETKILLQRYRDPNRPIPEITFTKNYSLRLGGVQVDLIYPGEGHDKGNIMIHLPGSKVLMFVDVATPKAVPFKNFSTTDIYSQVRGIERALKLDFDIYVAGHLHRPGKREEMQEVLKYYHDSKKANKVALKKVSFNAVRAQSKTRDVERLIGEYYQAVSVECTRILRKKWKPRLMGFEAFAPGHCDIWTGFHRTHKAP
jgi:glyoxylase-like metal-dependent hydrolase (beta-lactamase superfamily II)